MFIVELGCISLPGNYSCSNKVSLAKSALKKQLLSLHLKTHFTAFLLDQAPAKEIYTRDDLGMHVC